MLSPVVTRLHRIALLIALTIALVGTGFAHRLSLQDDELLAFVLATGATAADICDDATPGDDHRGPSCLACQIAGGADLPPIAGSELPMQLRLVAKVAAPRQAPWTGRSLYLAYAPQAPPFA